MKRVRLTDPGDDPARPWPADQIRRWPVDRLLPYAKNARLHTAADVKIIAASIRKFGFTNPILIGPDGTIIAGHGRVLAAKLLSLTEVPVMIAEGWSDEEKRAYCIADNQIAARASWDLEQLQNEISSLVKAEFDVGLLGFDTGALDELMKSVTQKITGDPEAVPAVPANPVTQPGDVWHLGRHRLACGDCTDCDTVATAMGGLNPSLMVTDPPYGVNYDPSWRAKATGKGIRATGKVLNDDRADWREAWTLFPGDVAYVWHAGLHSGVVADSLVAVGFTLRSQIIWAKNHFTLGRSDYHWQHETCLYVVREGARSHWASDRKQSTLWEITGNNATNPDREKVWGHGTQKPVEAMKRPIEHNSVPGDVIYDPFLGSGTTLIAAEMIGRTCVGLELSPAYADVIIRRWQEYTGEMAVREADGKTFAELSPPTAEGDADVA
jgi:DNA modification methylase